MQIVSIASLSSIEKFSFVPLRQSAVIRYAPIASNRSSRSLYEDLRLALISSYLRKLASHPRGPTKRKSDSRCLACLPFRKVAAVDLGANCARSAFNHLRLYRSFPREIQVRLIVKAGNDDNVEYLPATIGLYTPGERLLLKPSSQMEMNILSRNITTRQRTQKDKG